MHEIKYYYIIILLLSPMFVTGINIPRISCEMTCRLVKRLELRGRLHEMIKLRVQRDMALGRIMPTNIDDMIESACIDSAHSDSDVVSSLLHGIISYWSSRKFENSWQALDVAFNHHVTSDMTRCMT